MPKRKPSPDHLETIADHVARISWSLGQLQDAFSLLIIAQHGTDEDRAKVVKYLKGQFEAFQKVT